MFSEHIWDHILQHLQYDAFVGQYMIVNKQWLHLILKHHISTKCHKFLLEVQSPALFRMNLVNRSFYKDSDTEWVDWEYGHHTKHNELILVHSTSEDRIVFFAHGPRRLIDLIHIATTIAKRCPNITIEIKCLPDVSMEMQHELSHRGWYIYKYRHFAIGPAFGLVYDAKKKVHQSLSETSDIEFPCRIS